MGLGLSDGRCSAQILRSCCSGMQIAASPAGGPDLPGWSRACAEQLEGRARARADPEGRVSLPAPRSVGREGGSAGDVHVGRAGALGTSHLLPWSWPPPPPSRLDGGFRGSRGRPDAREPRREVAAGSPGPKRRAMFKKLKQKISEEQQQQQQLASPQTSSNTSTPTRDRSRTSSFTDQVIKVHPIER